PSVFPVKYEHPAAVYVRRIPPRDFPIHVTHVQDAADGTSGLQLTLVCLHSLVGVERGMAVPGAVVGIRGYNQCMPVFSHESYGRTLLPVFPGCMRDDYRRRPFGLVRFGDPAENDAADRTDKPCPIETAFPVHGSSRFPENSKPRIVSLNQRGLCGFPHKRVQNGLASLLAPLQA